VLRLDPAFTASLEELGKALAAKVLDHLQSVT
jgi:hypothetical protein